MARPLSEDPRSRVIEAVRGGLSRHEVAMRFAPSAHAVRWLAAWDPARRVAADMQVGDRRSRKTEAYSSAILAALRAKVDMTIAQPGSILHRDHGADGARRTHCMAATSKPMSRGSSPQSFQPVDLMVKDTLSPHERATVREIIAARGAELHHLPPFSSQPHPHRAWLLQARTRSAPGRTANQRPT